MSSIYDPLAAYLASQPGPRCTMHFSEIEALIGRRLPRSSRPPYAKWRNWWANTSNDRSRHSQANFGWRAAGWLVDTVDGPGETVTFRR